jgi:hypothetical protein
MASNFEFNRSVKRIYFLNHQINLLKLYLLYISRKSNFLLIIYDVELQQN